MKTIGKRDDFKRSALMELPHLRASLMAPSFASAPEFAKKTWSKQLCWVSRDASFNEGSLADGRTVQQLSI
jgi:hypothetical protein